MSYPFFQLSKKCGYAVGALFELALQGPSAPVNVRTLSKRQDIPLRFLEIILNELKQGGFVISTRGKSGGYQLSRPADEMTVGQIIRFLETSSDTVTSSSQQPHPGQLSLSQLMDDVNHGISEICDNATLAKLVDEYNKHLETFAFNYII